MKKPRKPSPPKRRTPAAASLADPKFKKRVIPSKKIYNRKKGND